MPAAPLLVTRRSVLLGAAATVLAGCRPSRRMSASGPPPARRPQLVPALQALLRIEHEVIYGYGVLGPRLPAALRRKALRRLDQHLLLRDHTAALIRGAGATPVAGLAAYAVPTPVTDAATALALAVRLEDATAAAATDVGAAASRSSTAGALALSARAGALAWAARWQAVAGAAGASTSPGGASQPTIQPSITSTSSASSSTAASGSTS